MKQTEAFVITKQNFKTNNNALNLRKYLQVSYNCRKLFVKQSHFVMQSFSVFTHLVKGIYES